MSTCTAYHLVLGTKSFTIPTFFRNLSDVKPEILTSLQTNGKYHVKSDVKEDVFGSFVKFWIQGEIFDVKKENYSQYHQLSQEFDMMKDVIELHRKKLIKTSALIYKNEKLKNKMKKKGEKLIQISKNYDEINRILFTNKMMISTYYNFLKVKEKLIRACKEQNVDFVNCLSSKKVKDLGCKLVFLLNEQKKTATIYRNDSVDEEILIPRTIENNSVECIVDGFFKNSFITESPAHSVIGNDLTSVRFSKDVEVKSIPMCFARNSNLTSIEIPSSVEEIQMDNLLKNTTLARIKVSPKNKNFIYYDDSFLIGKSDKKSDVFDVLYFVRRNINYAVVPSFIKYVKGYAFAGCENIIGVEFSEESELKSISKNAFLESSVKKLILPSSVEELESGWCDGLYNLNCIKVIKNKKQNISIYEDNFILGKSDPNSDVFDVLLFAKRDIKEALIPSFIKIISSYAFANYLLEKVEFSKDSQLFSIEKFAFYKTKLKSILIPLHVFQIGKSAFELSTINKICFMQNSELEKIGSRAFFKCNELEKVECEIINDHNTLLIRKYAFQDCVLLNAVDFLNKPEKLIIEKNAFLNTQLKLPSNVVFKNTIFNDDNYEYENGIRNVNQSFTKHISSYSFSNSNIKEITIPSSVIHIHHNAFAYSEVEKITFPDHLQKIDEFAFYRCINLKTIEFSEKSELNYIGDFAFADTPIEKIMIPSHVKRIGIEAFSKCHKLKTVTFSENSELNSIDKKAFYETGIESISIPDSVIYVGNSCFSGCVTLQTISFSEKSKLQSIGKHLFLESYLQNISIPSSIVSIDDEWCYQMEELSLPTVTIHQNEIQNIKYYDNKFIIGKSDLNSNSYDILILANQNIETAIIPSFIKKISSCAFNRCYNLQNIIFSDDSELTEICPSPFEGSSIESIIVPPKVTKIHSFTFADLYTLKNVEFSDKTESLTIERDAFTLSEIEKIVIPSDAILKDGWCHMTSKLKFVNLIEKPNSRIKLSENQILLGKTDDNNEEYDNLLFLPHEIKSFTIPSFITKISPYVFSQIRSIRFNEQSKLRKIEKESFHSSSIESVYIPSNITEIGSHSFCYCQKLKRVEFAENSNLKTIENNAFDTTALECIYIPDSVTEIKENAFQRSRYLKYIIISDKSELKYIGRRAFHLTAITQFFVPKSVREIDATAFNICDILQIIEIQENSSLKILTFSKCYSRNTKIIMIPADLRNNIEIVFDDSF